MAENRDRPRRFGTASGDRRRTPGKGFPVHIDPELTPPPQEPPRPETFPDYDTISPPVQRQLETLADGLGQVTEALGKVWDARRDGDKLERIDEKLGAIALSVNRHQTLLDESLIPQLDRWRAATDELTRQLPRITAAIEGLTLMVNAIDLRQRNLELEFRTTGVRIDGTIGGLTTRLDSHGSQIAQHATRIAALETTDRDAVVASTAISKRDKKLIAFVAAGASVVTFIAAKWQWIVSLFR